ncbi:MAG: hypothetical protein AMXMBFR59_34310 [Rhodanobacteraceae bacterium]
MPHAVLRSGDAAAMTKQFLIRNSNPLVSVHRVHGLKILPGLAYIDMVYQHFRRNGHDFAGLELRKLAIHQPMVLPGSEDILVEMQVLEVRSGVWQVLIYGTRQQDGRAVADKARYAVGEMHRCTTSFAPEEDQSIAPMREQARATEAIYSSFRERGLAHDGFMQVRGQAYSSATHAFADVSLGEEASADRTMYMFHPALLDGGVTCVAGALPGLDSGGGTTASMPSGLYLPLSYDSFRAVALIRDRCTTRIRHDSVRQRKELFIVTVDFLDPSGRKVAELRDLALKKLRTADAIAESPVAGASVRQENALPLPPVEPLRATPAATDARSFVRDFIAGVIARRLNVPAGKVDAEVGYYEMGLDSTGLLELVQLLESRLGISLPPTLLFEYATIAELTDHLLENHAEQLERMVQGATPPAPAPAPDVTPAPVAAPVRRAAAAPDVTPSPERSGPRGQDIAVIGMAGRFAQSPTIGELWRNLKEGKDCIVEIPPERWDWHTFDGFGTSVSRWGGFVADADCFDARFFRVTPRDAENIDPQERLFLEVTWEAIEDAGYTPKTLVPPRGASKRRDVGVFAGLMHRDYLVWQSQQLAAGQVQPILMSSATIANRVSYFCNFHGPSLVVDTQCSSSLTAIHMAIESVRHGECEVALAGGVNLSLHPGKYITYALLGLHSSDGRCRTFGEGGDGYVAAEGVGTVVLKPLAQAVADDDHIYAVIKASMANHVGTVSGISVPSSVAQADLIVRCLASADIDPASISYVEAHGTGTSLGDPIEIEGLSKAFRGRKETGNDCSIGSIKSNIGHAEGAAGVSGLIKLALQLHHATLVPSLHGDVPNPHIDWARTPFVVQRRLEPWQRPRLNIAGEERVYPRRGAVSSFGASGANVHIVMEEYVPAAVAAGEPVPFPALVPLSAQTAGQLRTAARRLQQHLREPDHEAARDVHRVARTLQVGRVEFAARAVFIAQDADGLCSLLDRFLRGEAVPGGWFEGEASGGDAQPEAADAAFVRQSLAGSRLDALAARWVAGAAVDWNALYDGAAPRRLPLPTYPFAKERYWIERAVAHASSRQGARANLLHPLLHENTSNLDEQRFSSRFDGEEFYLRDHVVVDARVLPGVAYLEMAHAALLHAVPAPAPRFRLRNIVWAQPVVVAAQPVTLHVALLRNAAGELGCEIYSGGDGARVIHFQCGAAPLAAAEMGSQVDLDALRRRCDGEIPVDDCYQLLGMGGLHYGAAFRSMQRIGTGTGGDGAPFVLTHLDLPETLRESAPAFHLHPSLLDGALQSSIGLSLAQPAGSGGAVESRPHLPYAVETLDVFGPCHDEIHVLVRRASGSSERLHKFDLQLCDAAGSVCVDIRGFSVRLLDRPPAQAGRAEMMLPAGNAPLTFAEEWHPQPLAVSTGAGAGAVICLLADEANRELLQTVAASAMPHRQPVFVAPAPAAGSDVPDAASYALALSSAAEQCGAPDAVVALWPVEKPDTIPDYRVLLAFVQGLTAANLPKLRVVLAAVCATPLDRAYVDSWIAVVASLKRLLPHSLQVVGIVADTAAPRDPSRALSDAFATALAELDDAQGDCAFYEAGTRLVRRMVPTRRTDQPAAVREGATYLVTGGLGAIGMHVAERLVHRHRANLLLLGRSAPDAATEDKLRALRASGSRVRHLQVDVADADALRAALETEQAVSGPIAGVFHVAGVAAGHSVFETSYADFARVLAPKVAGTLALDQALAGCALDFICYFSSSSAVLGDFGPCAYAIANRFQMAYARHAAKPAGGRRLAINWPLWKDGTFGFGDQAATDFYLQSSGQRVLQTGEALDLLEQILAEAPPQQLVLTGEPGPLRRLLANAGVSVLEPAAPEDVAAPVPDAIVVADPNDPLAPRLLRHLRLLLGASVKLPLERVSAETRLDEYGFDSMLAMQMTNELEKSFGSLSKTLFFEHRDLASLGRYLLQAHRPAVMRLFGVDASEASIPAAPRVVAAPLRQARALSVTAAVATAAPVVEDDVAIVGFSGRFPGANGLDEFWQRLHSGADCIGEVPRQRWDCDTHFDAAKGTFGKNYCRWGGFLDGVEDFDPLFFNITPIEAQFTDPQQRLFLETVWNLLEGCGYTRDALQEDYGGNVGVYVGSMYSEYGALSNDPGAAAAGGTSPQGGIANRVSYFFGLQGPSLAVDTMCSSAFVAIHMACVDLRRQVCRVAIAGGVNLSVHPKKYIALSQMQMLASDARGRSFGDTDGYLPAECVGAVLLKPLQRAIADGDTILGVVKGSALNHGGRGNGYSVPNPAAQIEVMEAALRNAQCTPESIGYVEAAANGSPLGDAIEMTALQNVFARVPRQTCPIGAVKSNMGHAEAASGMAQLAKVLLQMRHGELAPTIHADPPNPRIAFAESPFRLQTALSPWSGDAPRRALINSFGAGGSNASLVIESWTAPAVPEPAPTAFDARQIIIASAKSAERLRELVHRLKEYVAEHPAVPIIDLAYTLQCGRESMAHRIALVVSHREELLAGWEAYLTGRPNARSANVVTFVAGPAESASMSSFTGGSAGQALLETFIRENDHEKLALFWANGGKVPWASVRGARRRIVPLPGYPFARQRYWLESVPAPSVHRSLPPRSVPLLEADGRRAVPVVHPLLHANSSDLGECRFSSTFTGDEPYAAQDRVRQLRLIPEAVYFEMLRAAVERITGRPDWTRDGEAVRFTGLQWFGPVEIASAPVTVHVALRAVEADRIACEIYSLPRPAAHGEVPAGESDRRVHCRGLAVLGARPASLPVADLQPLRAGAGSRVSTVEWYGALSRMGMEYGEQYRQTGTIASGAGEHGAGYAVADLASPAVDDGEEACGLPPALLNVALQAALLQIAGAGAAGDGRPSIPAALHCDELLVLAPLGPSVAIHVHRASAESTQSAGVDIDIHDDSGILLARIAGLSVAGGESRAPLSEATADGAASPVAARDAVAPRNDLEATLLDIWQEALGFSGFGVFDSFLDLGGNSLRAALVVARVNEHYQVAIDVPALLTPDCSIARFSSLLVAELARQVGTESMS